MSQVPSLRRATLFLAAVLVLLGALVIPTRSVSAAAAISLSRGTAAPGDTVVVTGSGFHPGDAAGLAVYLSVRGRSQQMQVVMSVNGAGGFRTSFVVPAGTNPGTYRVTAHDFHGTSATRYITIWPLVVVRPGTTPGVTVIEGRRFYVSGSGFGANENVNVSVDYPLYNGDTQTVSVTARTGSGGSFYEAVLHVPWDATARRDTLNAVGASSGRKAAANVYVTYSPSVGASPYNLNPGKTVTVRGSGYVPGTHVNVSMTFPRTDGSTLTLSKSPVTDAYGNFTTTLTLPANITLGTHTITAADTVGGFRASTRINVTRAPQPTATITPRPTATSTAQPTATATATAKPKNKGVGFSWVSLWYHTVRQGTYDHLSVQTKPAKTMGIWVTVYFPNGVHYAYYENTNSTGFWQKQFNIPRHAISRKSNQAVITIQLWRGSKTTKYFMNFTLV